ncbi:MAG: hypothetical protein J2P29_02905 [Actinobacteria bacterium]|nr:hypothetical protein [Actinomycetota bacterium]
MVAVGYRVAADAQLLGDLLARRQPELDIGERTRRIKANDIHAAPEQDRQRNFDPPDDRDLTDRSGGRRARRYPLTYQTADDQFSFVNDESTDLPGHAPASDCQVYAHSNAR